VDPRLFSYQVELRSSRRTFRHDDLDCRVHVGHGGLVTLEGTKDEIYDSVKRLSQVLGDRTLRYDVRRLRDLPPPSPPKRPPSPPKRIYDRRSHPYSPPSNADRSRRASDRSSRHMDRERGERAREADRPRSRSRSRSRTPPPKQMRRWDVRPLDPPTPFPPSEEPPPHIERHPTPEVAFAPSAEQDAIVEPEEPCVSLNVCGRALRHSLHRSTSPLSDVTVLPDVGEAPPASPVAKATSVEERTCVGIAWHAMALSARRTG
jgi:hypothetical protein